MRVAFGSREIAFGQRKPADNPWELVGTGRHWHHVDMAIRDPQRLGNRVKAHRLQLYASRDAAAAAADMSKDTWQRVEEGRPVRESTYVRVDKALGWAPGSCILIGEGGEPILASEPPAGAAADEKPTAETARAAAYEAARAAMPRAPISEVDEFVDQFVKALHRVGEVRGGG